jgi:hypothetical protein
MHLSQDELAQQLQRAALKHGDRIAVSKRTVQRWESGNQYATAAGPRSCAARRHRSPDRIPGLPAGADAVVVEDGRGGHTVRRHLRHRHQ